MMPLVSVCMLTYNHEKYIGQAIESVLHQQVDFSIELVIGDDYSTDGTRFICEKYAQQFPQIVKLLPSEEKNIGPHQNFKRCYSACDGTYIAMLEGDDFWTQPDKLTKQIAFLELNPNYAFCSHSYIIVDENSNLLKEPTQDLEKEFDKGFDITLDNFFDRWYTKTLTTVYRKAYVNFDFDKYSMVTDTILYFNLLLNAKGYWMSFNAGAYRVHGSGIWSTLKLKNSLNMSYKIYLEMYEINKDNKSLKKALLDKIIQNIEYILHSDNQNQFSIGYLLPFCISLVKIRTDKWEALKYIKNEVYNKLKLRLKIKIRKRFGIYPSC